MCVDCLMNLQLARCVRFCCLLVHVAHPSRRDSTSSKLAKQMSFEEVEVPTGKTGFTYSMERGIACVRGSNGIAIDLKQPSWDQFVDDFDLLLWLSVHGPV